LLKTNANRNNYFGNIRVWEGWCIETYTWYYDLKLVQFPQTLVSSVDLQNTWHKWTSFSWDMTSPHLVASFRHAEGSYCFRLQGSVRPRIMPTKGREWKSTAIMTVFFKLLDSQLKLNQRLFLATLGIGNKSMW